MSGTTGGGGAVTWEGGASAGELPGLPTPNHSSSSNHSGDTEPWGESRLGVRPTVRLGGGQGCEGGRPGGPLGLTWGEAGGAHGRRQSQGPGRRMGCRGSGRC